MVYAFRDAKIAVADAVAKIKKNYLFLITLSGLKEVLLQDI